MLNLFQELIPFSNKRLDKSISSDQTYSNPVIMSFAFDFTVCSNVLETVLYIRNDAQTECYSNVVITLMKQDPTITSPVATSGTIGKYADGTPNITINGYTSPLGSSIETFSVPENITIQNSYMSNYIPIISGKEPLSGNVLSTDSKIGVKFSYGYDEISNVDWETKSSALCIPNIGYKSTDLNPFGTPDTSYYPVRMRLTWKAQSTLLTIRDYFIDVSYEKAEAI